MAYLLTIKRVYRDTKGGTLAEAVDNSSTDISAIELEHIVDFDPDGGIAVFEPGTAREEEFEYGGVDESARTLTGVVRPNTLAAHASGTKIQAGETAETEMLADGFLEDEDVEVTGVPVPAEYEMTLGLGAYDQETRPTVPVDLDDEDEVYVSGAPIGTPLTLKTDSGSTGVQLSTDEDLLEIGVDALFRLVDVAGSVPSGVAGKATIFFDSLGAGGAGLYWRNGTGAAAKFS